ncbi:MAG: tetratricopeptide repeat protein [Spirochaetota bacterium]
MKFRLASFLFCVIAVTHYSVLAQNSTELYLEGARLATEGELAQAKEIFKQVIVVSPYYALGHYGIGRAYMYEGGDLSIAIRELKLAVSLDDRLAQAHFYLGLAYYLNNEYEHAISSLYYAYQLDDTYLEALYNIGAIYDYMGHSSKALLYYKRYRDEKQREEEYFDY